MMRRGFETRLIRLERIQYGPMHTRVHSTKAGDVIEWARKMLVIFGAEQEKTESLAEALARALRISMSDLRDRLSAAAAGGSFWKAEELLILTSIRDVKPA